MTNLDNSNLQRVFDWLNGRLEVNCINFSPMRGNGILMTDMPDSNLVKQWFIENPDRRDQFNFTNGDAIIHQQDGNYYLYNIQHSFVDDPLVVSNPMVQNLVLSAINQRKVIWPLVDLSYNVVCNGESPTPLVSSFQRPPRANQNQYQNQYQNGNQYQQSNMNPNGINNGNQYQQSNMNPNENPNQLLPCSQVGPGQPCITQNPPLNNAQFNSPQFNNAQFNNTQFNNPQFNNPQFNGNNSGTNNGTNNSNNNLRSRFSNRNQLGGQSAIIPPITPINPVPSFPPVIQPITPAIRPPKPQTLQPANNGSDVVFWVTIVTLVVLVVLLIMWIIFASQRR